MSLAELSYFEKDIIRALSGNSSNTLERLATGFITYDVTIFEEQYKNLHVAWEEFSLIQQEIIIDFCSNTGTYTDDELTPDNFVMTFVKQLVSRASKEKFVAEYQIRKNDVSSEEERLLLVAEIEATAESIVVNELRNKISW